VVKSGRLLLLQDFKISLLETASAIFHIQIASFEKPDIFLTDPFLFKNDFTVSQGLSKQQLGPHGMGTVSGGFRLIKNQTK
jgi:hypothetical protein